MTLADNQAIADDKARQDALDPTRSFIVQAPAGSGKTELLTRRFLSLLSVVSAPEEIIAITFTRKAAAEMRARIASTLPASQSTRLRVMTIDALCGNLVQQMPLKAKLGSAVTISADPSVLYAKAVQNLLLLHSENSFCTEALKQLLSHLDNDVQRLNVLCIDILANRDQWLPHIFGMDAIHALENALYHVGKELIEKCCQTMPESLRATFTTTFNLSDQIVEWQAIINHLLTKQGTWRKKLSPSKHKSNLQRLMPTLVQYEDLRKALVDILNAPPMHYRDDQVLVIKALSTLLPVLVAELQLVFQHARQMDFIEIALRASDALGDAEHPTDLALRLDYQIQHLLIDEFQDTSVTQLRFIEKLIAGWQAGDGRTLFLVGDPMQSIYRFRKAEVGLFLQVQQQGIGNIRLETIVLRHNFRAAPELVQWHNQAFRQIFPYHADPSVGAIAYSPSEALPATIENSGVYYHYFDKPSSEAEKILAILQQTWQTDPNLKIAILVRARQHLRDILPLLQKHAIPYRTVDMATLQESTVVQDLFSLTRALCHPADRIAWLSILRAPWCGLSLHDLHTLFAHDHQQLIWDLLQQANPALLSQDSMMRYQHFLQAMSLAMAQRGRLSLAEWVEQTWVKLLGPACLTDNHALRSAEAYFTLLHEFTINLDTPLLEKRLNQLTLPVDPDPSVHLEIMTIHKAKGLEFDVVILPGLHKLSRTESARLFLWTERINATGGADLLVAPVKAAHQKHDALYAYLKSEEEKRQRYELQRLLYVAATRAKKQLHLLLPTFMASSSHATLLSELWPVVAECLLSQPIMPPTINEKIDSQSINLPLQRLSSKAFFLHKKATEIPTLSMTDNRKVWQKLIDNVVGE